MFSFIIQGLLSRRNGGKQDWRSVPWFAIDCETNGLNANQDALLSLAWVPIAPPFVRIGAAQYAVIHHDQPLSQSAVVHQLTSAELQQGEVLKNVLERFAEATAGAYLVAHYAAFDRTVLHEHMRREGISWQPQGWYDTLAVEKKHAAGEGKLQQSSLTLAESRNRYGLPSFIGHHARNDAVACAELFLAQNYSVKTTVPLSLSQVLKRGR
ncbi:MAG TPA: 3'-5' exonuclease [Aliidiomarina sp.]|nr:3'-5' exonuclease [Aliidiomarina sp.]